jgi:hypothetical protein
MKRDFRTFNPHVEEWESFIYHFDQTCKEWQVPNSRKAPFLLKCLDRDTFRFLCRNCPPGTVSLRTYDELLETLKKYFYPRKSVSKEKRDFANLSRDFDESINLWMIQVKKAAYGCDFGVFEDDVILQKFLTGVRGKALNEIMRNSNSMSINTAWAIAQRYELEERIEKLRYCYMEKEERIESKPLLDDDEKKVKEVAGVKYVREEPREIDESQSLAEFLECGNPNHKKLKNSKCYCDDDFVCALCNVARYIRMYPDLIIHPSNSIKPLFEDADIL